jgi:chromosome segregation ATPase
MNHHQPKRKMNRLTTICFLAAVLAIPGMGAESAPSTSDQLTTAKQELLELRVRYKDQHPRVREQLRRIEELEREVAAQQEESTKLRVARAELAELRRRYEDQLRKVEELQRQAKRPTTESAELQAARARFAKVRQMYRERHPKYQEALRTLQDLDRQQPGTK